MTHVSHGRYKLFFSRLVSVIYAQKLQIDHHANLGYCSLLQRKAHLKAQCRRRNLVTLRNRPTRSISGCCTRRHVFVSICQLAIAATCSQEAANQSLMKQKHFLPMTNARHYPRLSCANYHAHASNEHLETPCARTAQQVGQKIESKTR